MNETPVTTYADFILPPSVVSKIDVSRLVSEVEKIDNEMTSVAVRTKTGVSQPTQSVPSEQLAEFIGQNKLDLTNGQKRSELIALLRQLKDNVPVIHMTFAVVADRESLQQCVQWLRASIHPQTVITVGLQPALVAGVYLRTPNHVHDLSLRAMLEGSHGALVKDLEALRGGQ